MFFSLCCIMKIFLKNREWWDFTIYDNKMFIKKYNPLFLCRLHLFFLSIFLKYQVFKGISHAHVSVFYEVLNTEILLSQNVCITSVM